MNLKCIRDNMKLVVSWLFMPIYIPHILLYFRMGGRKSKIAKDIIAMTSRLNIKLSTISGLLFFLHTNSYFRSLFYYRIGPIWSTLISWYRPGNKYFIISQTLELEGGFLFAHPYSTILNAEKIGRNFSCRHCTTLGAKNNNERPRIGDNVILGASVTIIGGISIGNNVIVGAGSVVVKDIPDDCVVAGNPAKIIKSIK